MPCYLLKRKIPRFTRGAKFPLKQKDCWKIYVKIKEIPAKGVATRLQRGNCPSDLEIDLETDLGVLWKEKRLEFFVTIFKFILQQLLLSWNNVKYLHSQFTSKNCANIIRISHLCKTAREKLLAKKRFFFYSFMYIWTTFQKDFVFFVCILIPFHWNFLRIVIVISFDFFVVHSWRYRIGKLARWKDCSTRWTGKRQRSRFCWKTFKQK